MQARFVDCRPRDAYLAGHVPAPRTPIPSATDRRRRRRPPPAPSAETFAAWASAAGIGPDTLVVAYDDGTGWAARLWWLLRHFGHDAAAVIPLGVARPARRGGGEIAPATFVPRARTDDTADAAELLARLGTRR